MLYQERELIHLTEGEGRVIERDTDQGGKLNTKKEIKQMKSNRSRTDQWWHLKIVVNMKTQNRPGNLHIKYQR